MVAADGRGSPDLIRAPGSPDRPLDAGVVDRKRTEALGPGARQVVEGLFQAGRKLLLVGYDGAVRRRWTSDCIAFPAAKSAAVMYCDGRNLLEVTAVKTE
ncbi:hypothetical protein ACFU6I_07775 [Streptomyces sp. NPDC057486]|uniref:hypothetical protein n=1 Tax=Streptomyces sp. NPDC057486 TaxID=3346145 RepID=UPI0036826DFD